MQTSYQSLSLSTPRKDVSHPRDNASWKSKLLFGWATQLLNTGSKRRLDPDDLWRLEHENQCETISSSFEKGFTKTNSVFHAFLSVHGVTVCLVGALQIVIIFGTYVGPMALQQILQAIEGNTFDIEAVFRAIGMLFLSKVLAAFVQVHADFTTQMVVLRFTSALQHMLFKKTLRLDAACRRKKTAGDIANLFSADMQWISSFSSNANLVWTAPVRVVVTLFMLYNVIGWAAFVGSGALVLAFVINHGITTIQGWFLTAYMKQNDQRMKAVNEIFGSIKVVKLNAWEERFEKKIVDLRQSELRTLGKYVLTESAQTALLFTTPVLVTLVSFFTYTMVMQETLSVSKIFTAMSLFALLKYPMMGLPQAIVAAMQAIIAIKRIENFLQLEEKKDVDVSAISSIDSSIAIQMHHASFGWDANTPMFKDLSLTIHRGETVILHGPVSQGKSSLCQAILGEMVQHGDSAVHVRGNVAYVPQQPWIQHMTIRENILFGKPYDRTKYNAVIEACALTKDLAFFPAGDRTEIGQKGVNLSGGQQARISLARACYSDADIYILDAPLSAVDGIVQREIFTKCILGLLRNKTVLLVTHNEELINTKEIRRTIEVKDGQLNECIVPHTLHEPDIEPIPVLSDCLPTDVHYEGFEENVQGSLKSPLRMPTNALVFTPVSTVDEHLYDDVHVSGKLIVEETRSEGRVSNAVFWAYVQASGGWYFIIGIGCLLVLNSTIQVSSDLWISTWSNTAAHVTPATFLAESSYYLSIYSFLALSGCVVAVCRAFAAWAAGLRASRKFFNAMTTSLFRAPMSFFDTNPVGRILNRYSNDMTSVDTRIPTLSGGFLTLAVSAAFTIGTTILTMKSMAFLILPLLFYYYRMATYYLQSARSIERVNTVTKSPLLNLTTEVIEGAQVIRAYGPDQVARLQQAHYRNVDRNNEAFFTAQIANQWFILRTQLFSAFMLLAISISLVTMRVYLSPGVIGLVLNYSFQILPLLELVVFLWSLLETQMVAPERISEYTLLESEPPRVIFGSVPHSWPHAGAIHFKNVSFSYKKYDRLVLKNINLDINAGEKIGLVGRTGAGKSSLTMALFRINELASGCIRIDNVDISKVGVQTLRSRIAIVPQSPVLFQGTLREYLDPSSLHSDDDLWTALRKVQLADRFANTSSKLDAQVDENGDNFSVGERQILCMARALLSKAMIIVLDEATASTDSATDQHLQHVIRTEFARATVLIIAHRLDSVMSCDRIMVFDKGEIVQFDTPKSLTSNGDGAFYELCLDAQQT